MTAFDLHRLAFVLEPEPGNANESDGILNPASARDGSGRLYLFPRLVARNNYSRIGILRVNFDDRGDPRSVERLGIALEPEADYEHNPTGGGCEDPRVSFVDDLGLYVMTYTALSSAGPRIALATSEDLLHWQRVGLAVFDPYDSIRFEGIADKDATLFPTAIPDPSGQASMAMLHRPLFPGTRPEETVSHPAVRTVDPHHESIWISYCSKPIAACERHHLSHFGSHHLLAAPVAQWERLKIGGGTPPVLTRLGWLIVYHGVCEAEDAQSKGRLRYSAGVMVLSTDHPRHILYRSPEPVLAPERPQELEGTPKQVVFPTAIDRRDDLGTPDRFDVYYGMADSRIGVARLDLPQALPSAEPAPATQPRV